MLPVPIRRPYEVERLPQTRVTALLSLLLRAADLMVLVAAAFLAHKLRFATFDVSIDFERAIARGLLFALLILGPSSASRAGRGPSAPDGAMFTRQVRVVLYAAELSRAWKLVWWSELELCRTAR